MIVKQITRTMVRKFLTQHDLAEKMGVHATRVSDWEQGIYQPSMRNLRKLCEILEVTSDQIDWPEPKKDLDVVTHVEAHSLHLDR